MRTIFQDRCWVVNIPFVSMVKFKFLAHFPVDHLIIISSSSTLQVFHTSVSG